MIDAVDSKNLELITLLVETYKPDVNERTSTNWTALHSAARLGNKEITTYLLNAGADIHVKNKNGQTRSLVARAYGHEKTALLLEYLLRKRKDR